MESIESSHLLPSFPFSPNVDLNLIKSELRPKPCYTAILAEQYKDAGRLDLQPVSITVVPVFSTQPGPETREQTRECKNYHNSLPSRLAAPAPVVITLRQSQGQTNPEPVTD